MAADIIAITLLRLADGSRTPTAYIDINIACMNRRWFDWTSSGTTQPVTPPPKHAEEDKVTWALGTLRKTWISESLF